MSAWLTLGGGGGRVASTWLVQSSAAIPVVEGTLILKPVYELRSGEPITNVFDRTPEEQATNTAFAQAVQAADGLWEDWYDRINDAGGAIAGRAESIVDPLSDLTTAATTQSLKTITSPGLLRQAEWLQERIEQNRANQTHYQTWLARTGDQSIRSSHEALRETISLRYAAEDAATAARTPISRRGSFVASTPWAWRRQVSASTPMSPMASRPAKP